MRAILRLFLVLSSIMCIVPVAQQVQAGQITSDCAGTARLTAGDQVRLCLATVRDSETGPLFAAGSSTTLGCLEIRELYRDARVAAGMSAGPPTAPDCSVITRALEKLQVTPAWAACLPLDGVGTTLHAAKCLPPYLAAFGLTKDTAGGCDALAAHYDRAVASTGYVRNGSASCEMITVAMGVPLEKLEATMRPENASPAPPPRKPCAYDIRNPVGAFEACMNGQVRHETTCDEALDEFERRATWENDHRTPSGFVRLSCENIETAMSRLKAALPELPKAAPVPAYDIEAELRDNDARAQARATSQQTTISWIILGVIGVIAFGVIYHLYWRRAHKKNFRRTEMPEMDEHAIRRMAQEKHGEFAYAATAEVHFVVSTDKGSAIDTLRFSFRMSRNLAAMTHRERESVKMFLLLRLRGWLPEGADNRIHLGLAYGGGKAAIDGYDYTIPGRVMKQHGIKNISDAIDYYVRETNVNTEASISELLTIFGEIKATRPDDPLVKELAASLSSGGRWFTSADIPGSDFEARTAGLFLGILEPDNIPMAYYGEGSLVTIAPPGAGKTQCHIIPNLLTYSGPAIILDIKGELWRTTSKWRERFGPVYRFAPYDPERTYRFNPLTTVRQDPLYLWEDAAALAELMIVPNSQKDLFFEQTAQRTLAGFIAYVCRTTPDPKQRSMSRVLDLAAGIHLERYFDKAGDDHEIDDLAREAKSLENMADVTRAGVLAQISTSLKGWTGQRVKMATSHSDWDLSDIRRSNSSIYICVAPDEVEQALSMLRVFIGQHLRVLTRREPLEGEPDVVFFLDEFPQLRRMTPIETGVDVARSYGVKLWLIAQSLSQIRSQYRDRADGLIGQCGVRCYMNLSLQDDAAQKISADIGYFESVIDGHRVPIVEPQELAGPKYGDKVIAFGRAANPMRLTKYFAMNSEMYTQAKAMGEAELPKSDREMA